MDQLRIKEIISSKYPQFLSGYPLFVKKYISFTLEKLLYLKRINKFISEHNDKSEIEFIDELLEYLDITYTASSKDRSKIPSEGKLLIVANHPLGGLDGLILLKLISEVRRNVKIIANDLLMNVPNLSNLFLPYDLFYNKNFKKNYEIITNSIKNEDAIIIFPAGEVSRFSFGGIKDSKWKKGVVYFADKYQIPVLPVYIKSRNSIIFYFISLIHKSFSTLLLPHELFNKKGKTFHIKIGNHISHKAFSTKYQKIDFLTKTLKKHVQLIGKNKKGIFETEKNVIHPVETKKLREQLADNKYLGNTSDGKMFYFVDYKNGKDIIKEISRLRELTFRKVGEGTGLKNDFDIFDKYYKHLVLWDDEKLEIAGSYRLGFGKEILDTLGRKGFYTSTLFDYNDKFFNYLPYSIEMGRSFLQSKYWNSLALDYLWQGVGKILQSYPQIRYLFGPVSLSNNYSSEAKNLIIYFYKKWFPEKDNLISSKIPFIISDKSMIEMQEFFSFNDFRKEFILLKNRLKLLGFSIPTLYKQYSDLCAPGGVQFLSFNVDPVFQNCVDAFILIDLTMIKDSKKERYLSNNNNSEYTDFIKSKTNYSKVLI